MKIRYHKKHKEHETAFLLLQKKLADKWNLPAEYCEENPDIEFVTDKSVPPEGYRILCEGGKTIRICGGDAPGLYYGIGRFLRLMNIDSGILPRIPKNGISSVPEKKIRGTYFATHFHNYYHDAPLEEITCYIEDLMLWGCNTLVFWFDMHEYTGLNDPAAQKMIARLMRMNDCAKSLHMKSALIYTANEFYKDSPAEFRAQSRSEGTPYRTNLAAHYHLELCPSKEEGLRQILQARSDMLAAFKSADFDYFIIWPYDAGGCTCSACYPWGSNGFVKLAKELSSLTRHAFPRAKIILSTWLFDHFTSGEWDGLYDALERDSTWCDLLLAQFTGKTPERIIQGHTPGGLPLIGFPEISMHGAVPWGGFGINAYPQRIAQQYSGVRHLCQGGLLYSEGIFEDLNKAVHLQLYWGEPDARKAMEIYCAYTFSPETAGRVAQLLYRMEHTLPRRRINHRGEAEDYPDTRYKVEALPCFILDNPGPAEDIEEEAAKIEALLPDGIKTCWRWRIVRLRSIIDRHLAETGGRLTDELDQCFAELRCLYRAENAYYCVSPPEKQAIFANRGGFTWD